MSMRKCHWLRSALLALCVAIPLPVWALGMGEIEVESALNEKFSATIEVQDINGLRASEIIVSMASREDFDRVGVERFFFLTNLQFEVRVLNSDTAEVVITSQQPISEPYLDFIVEVLWPSGRMLKEFTVLLDPPTFSQAAAPAVSAPQQSTSATGAGRIDRQTDRPSQVAVPRSAPTAPNNRPAPRPRVADGDGLMTTRDDTLWKIAQRTLPSERVSVNQQMLALQRLNPEAFINDNINLLKAGYVLRIPDEGQALQLSDQDAQLAVADQTAAWRNPSLRPSDNTAPAVEQPAPSQLASQVDATSAAPATADNAGNTSGEVRILAQSGTDAAGTGTGDDPGVNQLIEEKDALTRQVDELQYQLDREKDIASNEISVKDRQLEVKDQEIAQLQEQLKTLRETVEQSLDQAQNQNQRPAPETDTAWWMSPTILFGVIGFLILLLVVLMIMMRRNRGAEDDYVADAYEEPLAFEDEPEEDIADAQEAAASIEPVIGNLEEDEELPQDVIGDDEIEEAVAEDEPLEEDAGETQASQTSDVVGEADIYIAYGRYGQAANLLLGVLNDAPDRHDVRLKLLEVYVETSDSDSFAQHAQYLIENCENEDVLLACRELEGRLGDDQVDFSSETLDITAADEGAAPLDAESSAAGEPTVDDFNLDLDELPAIDSSADDSLSLDDEAPDGQAAQDDEFQLEFDEGLDLDNDPAAPAQGDENDRADDVLGGDLGIDFDPERDVADELVESAQDEAAETVAEAVEQDAADADQPADEDAALPDIEFDLDELGLGDELDESTEDISGADASDDTPESPAEASADADDDFEFGDDDDGDINTTKLDLAEAYIDMGDGDGAKDILEEVLQEGSAEQQDKARQLLEGIS